MSSFLFPIFLPFNVLIFYISLRSPSTSITSSTLSQNSFAQRKIPFSSSQSQSGCARRKNASCISFQRLSSIQFCWIFKRQQRCSKKFFRLRISKILFLFHWNFHLWSKQRAFKEACRCLRLLELTKNTSRTRMQLLVMWKTRQPHKRNINFHLMLSAFIPFLINFTRLRSTPFETETLVMLLKNAWKTRRIFNDTGMEH